MRVCMCGTPQSSDSVRAHNTHAFKGAPIPVWMRMCMCMCVCVYACMCVCVYVCTSVDPLLDSDESYVGTMQLWNCSKGWCEQQSNVKQFRQRKLSNEIAERIRRTISQTVWRTWI